MALMIGSSEEITDREAVRRAVRGAGAVVSALGPSLDRKHRSNVMWR